MINCRTTRYIHIRGFKQDLCFRMNLKAKVKVNIVSDDYDYINFEAIGNGIKY